MQLSLGGRIMGFFLEALAIETTRRCNIRCKHCMRGPAENIDLTEQLVDIILDNREIDGIDEICFSGGEPTLNPKIIIYTIDKIISEGLDVHNLVMVTNGQIFNEELVAAFNRFNTYRNQILIKQINERYTSTFTFKKKYIDDLIATNMDNHVRITFSTDQYHSPLDLEVAEAYRLSASHLKITENALSEDDVYKTGFADFGREFNYKLKKLRYCKEKKSYWIIDTLYVTANGYLTSQGDGQYSDMDKINMGHILDINYRDMLIKYGTPVFNTTPITEDTNFLVKK